MYRLRGKVAIITGAASGQGRAGAILFAKEGAKVVVSDLDEEGATAVAAAIGDAAIAIRHDVSDASSWDNVVLRTLEAFGHIDILVNNAGIYKPLSFQDTDQQLLDLHYRVNVLGVFLGMKAVYQPMLNAGGGAIINTASGAGMRGVAGMVAYSGSKWMVRGISKSTAVDVAADNIRVNVILPGLIDTAMLRENPPEVLEAMKSLPPAKRIGTAEEIAEAALYLASDASSYTTGAEIAVCGGLMA